MKEKVICTCKVPQPRTKCSENGVTTYCAKCLKQYEKNN